MRAQTSKLGAKLHALVVWNIVMKNSNISRLDLRKFCCCCSSSRNDPLSSFSSSGIDRSGPPERRYGGMVGGVGVGVAKTVVEFGTP